MEKKEGVIEFHFRERKLLLVKILVTKKINFYIKWFYMMNGVKIKCFLTLKITKKNISKLWNIFCFELIMDFGTVFCVFRGHGLIKQDSNGVF